MSNDAGDDAENGASGGTDAGDGAHAETQEFDATPAGASSDSSSLGGASDASSDGAAVEFSAAEKWFIGFAAKRFNLPHSTAVALVGDARKSGEQPHQLALLRGLFDATQTSIIETLQKPLETLKDFEFQDVLGRGGMGVVYLARQVSLDRAVAVKTILTGATAGDGRFEAEGRTIARLRHPNIVAAYDLIRQGGRLYLVLELLEGESLEDRLQRQGTLSEALTWQLIRQAAAGLLYATGENIVHRDIKPGNLFLSDAPPGFPLPAGVPLLKLTDFGLAALIDRTAMEDEMRLTGDGRVLGTPAYMAPEQLSTSEVDHRADLYALGATAHHLISGQPPFAGEPFTRLLVRKTSEAPPQISSLSASISKSSSELVSQLLQTNPDQRLQTYQELIDRIDAILPGLQRLPPAPQTPLAVTATMASIPAKAPTDSLCLNETLDETAQGHPSGAAANTLPARSATILRRAAMSALLAVAVVAVCSGVVWLAWPAAALPVATPMMAAGASTMLFNGESLAGWKAARGVTRPTLDAEGGNVLEINGGAFRPLPAALYFTLEMGVDLQQGEQLELWFEGAGDALPPGFIVRITRKEFTVFQPGAERTLLYKQALPPGIWKGDISEPSYHTLKIQREPAQWVVVLGETGVNLSPHTTTPAATLHLQTSGPVFLEAIEFAPKQPAQPGS